MKKRKLKKVTFYKNVKKGWRWRVRSPNGKKLCNPGEGFSSKKKAVKNFELIRDMFVSGEYTTEFVDDSKVQMRFTL